MPPTDTADKSRAAWLTPQNLVTAASVLIGVGGLMVTVNDHGRRITKLEGDQQVMREKTFGDISELRADVKVLLTVVERIERAGNATQQGK